MPKTPKFQVCSEDLDLHWSGSDSSLVEAQDGIDGETALETSDKANDDSGDVFGDTISDSFLDRAMDQQQQSVPGKLRSVEESWSKRDELSPGIMLALGAWIVRWSFVLGRRRVGRRACRWTALLVRRSAWPGGRGETRKVAGGEGWSQSALGW